ncbi:hypothetical protein GH714_025288 [Hevea brasiliensis]|uniref:RING-type E3 ubiquitin transferase n=1 Tax=Hevea brasiliensis TaxID=3981 RepID=A0A6A6M4F5_HEVBR|nr:hypothetical protein GH714_025288 [Hevea brasiliensis]
MLVGLGATVELLLSWVQAVDNLVAKKQGDRRLHMIKDPNLMHWDAHFNLCNCTMKSISQGMGQKFCQPSGTGIDLGLDHLSKPTTEEDMFPLVICAEACLSSFFAAAEPDDQPLPTMSPHAQITQAVLDKNNKGHFQVKIMKQILWVDGIHYELREINLWLWQFPCVRERMCHLHD